jgi:hypothetical protein
VLKRTGIILTILLVTAFGHAWLIVLVAVMNPGDGLLMSSLRVLQFDLAALVIWFLTSAIFNDWKTRLKILTQSFLRSNRQLRSQDAIVAPQEYVEEPPALARSDSACDPLPR